MCFALCANACAPVCTCWQKVDTISVKAGAADIRRTPSLLSVCWDMYSSRGCTANNFNHGAIFLALNIHLKSIILDYNPQHPLILTDTILSLELLTIIVCGIQHDLLSFFRVCVYSFHLSSKLPTPCPVFGNNLYHGTLFIPGKLNQPIKT